jgi:hypothetical protein
MVTLIIIYSTVLNQPSIIRANVYTYLATIYHPRGCAQAVQLALTLGGVSGHPGLFLQLNLTG